MLIYGNFRALLEVVLRSYTRRLQDPAGRLPRNNIRLNILVTMLLAPITTRMLTVMLARQWRRLNPAVSPNAHWEMSIDGILPAWNSVYWEIGLTVVNTWVKIRGWTWYSPPHCVGTTYSKARVENWKHAKDRKCQLPATEVCGLWVPEVAVPSPLFMVYFFNIFFFLSGRVILKSYNFWYAKLFLPSAVSSPG